MADTSKREELIEALAAGVHECDGWMSDAQNAQLEWDGPNRVIHFCGQGSIDVGHLAAIALAVFEQAHTPTDDECLGLIDRATEAFARHEGAPTWQDDPKGRDAALRWHMRGYEDGLNARRSVQVDPTDDEREALANLIPLDLVHDRGREGFPQDAFEAADAILAAGFRRTVQGEPTDAIPDDDQIAADNADWHTEYTEPQGEASDVQVDAALRAYYKEPRGDWVNQFGPNMRAALRAAAEQGENR